MYTPLIRSLTIALVASACFVLGCSNQESSESEMASDHSNADNKEAVETAGMSEQEQLNKPDPVGEYGNGLTLKAQTELTSILADPESYEGKRVQVAGVVNEVCPKRGCWIELAKPNSSETIRVKVTDGDIVFPLSAKDQPAIVEGIIERIELDEEGNRNWQAHLAEERGETFDPETVHGPAIIWRIHGEGAQIGS